MDKNEEFDVTYGNDDGYAGGSRPHYFSIGSFELEEEMTEEGIKSLFWDKIDEDFKQNHLNIYSDQESEFVEWAKKQIAAMQEESE